jgi:uncharacterized protein (TIGR00730 family)
VEKGDQPVIFSSSLSYVKSSVSPQECSWAGESEYGPQGSDPATCRVCVFAGSALGSRQVYQQAARALGKELARRELGLVYGGANVGLMGEVANAVLLAGGEVIGVVPRGLWSREANHSGLSMLYEVETMHERKALMAELADGFIALPGGLGTFDELFEALTWAQLGLHTKPIGLLNIAGYFKPLLKLVASTLREGFISRDPPVLVSEGGDVGMLLDQLIQARQAVLSAPQSGHTTLVMSANEIIGWRQNKTMR